MIRSITIAGHVLVFCMLAIMATVSSADSDKTVYGWIENARIEPWGVEIKAKLDTGALTSSLHATDIEQFERDGETWVRFNTHIEDQRDEEMASREFERPLFRSLKIKGAGGTDHRPVVLLKICMNDTIYEEQFSLRDRGDMIYPLLLGRRTIRHLGLVDVQETFEHEPTCDDDAPVIGHEEQSDDDDREDDD